MTNNDQFNVKTRSKYWKARYTLSLVLLALSFVGMIVVDFAPSSSWIYWCFMIPAFALLCLWLSWLDREPTHGISGITLLHEIAHWVALLLTIYLISIFVKLGIMSDLVAGLATMNLLALATFLAGIYIDATFLLIGILLGFFTLISAFFVKYLFIIAIPLIVIIAVLLFWLHYRHKISTDDLDDD